jgi:hypothetical protein
MIEEADILDGDEPFETKRFRLRPLSGQWQVSIRGSRLFTVAGPLSHASRTGAEVLGTESDWTDMHRRE